MTTAERRVARALLSKYPTAGLESAAALAERAGASAPTVVRFVGRLGVGGYREFQSLLRDEVQQRRASPTSLSPQAKEWSGPNDLQTTTAGRLGKELVDSISSLPPGELERAVDMLAARRSRVTGFGGRYSRLLAEYLDLHLRLMRSDTRVHQLSQQDNGALIVDSGRRDVFVVFDFRRYQRDVADLAQALHGRGSQILLITDPWLSPIAEVADTVLPVRVSSPSPFDTFVPALSVVEVLVAGLHEKLGDGGMGRIAQIDALRADTPLD